ncbi:MAG: hypothetical protein OEN20_05505 [Gammaproteobacteria bacterium]|nr:hypothetical protein [Gammaproteobacteria bacterium]
MHRQILHGQCSVRHEQRGFFSALRPKRRKWWRNRHQAYVIRRRALTDSQQDKLAAQSSPLHGSRDRTRSNVAELLPQLDELLLPGDASSEAVAAILRGGLKTLEREFDAVAV